MNNVLVGIGVLIVAVLSALFAVPQFVDWNAYRGVIEEEASRMAGRDVRIAGGINLSLLPVPSISIQKLRVADVASGSGEPLFRAESVDAKLSIAPLLRGVLEANEIELVRPVLHFVLDDAGRGNWRNLSLGRGTLPFAPNDVALQSVKITDGTVSLLDRSGTRERLTLDHLGGQLSAPALKGPYRFRGQFGDEDLRRDLQFTTVPPDAGSAVKFKVVLKDVASGASATLDGRLQADDGRPQFNGDLTALLPRPGSAGQAVKASAGAAVPLADLKAEVNANSSEAALTNLSIAFDSAGRPEVLSGGAHFSWEGELKTEATLATPWLDLDNVLGNPDGGNPLTALASFAQRINSLVPGKGTTVTRLEIDQASLGHDAVGGILIDARSTAGLLALEQVHAILPGGSRIEIQGRIAGQDSTTTFDGDMTLRGTSLARFVTWSTGGGVAISPANDQPFQMRGRVALEPSQSGLTDIVATIGDSSLNGNITYSWQDQHALRIAIDGVRVDARAIAPERTSLATLMRQAANRLGAASDTGASNGQTVAVQFDFNAAELVLPDLTLQDVSAKLQSGLQGFSIERLQFSAAHGVAVGLTGNMAVASNPADRLPQAVSARPMRGSIAAGDTEGLKTLATLFDLPAALGWEQLPATFLPMRLAGSLVRLPQLGDAGSPRPTAVVADGQFGKVASKIKIGLSAGIEIWRTTPVDFDVVLLAPQDVRLTAMAIALLRRALFETAGGGPAVHTNENNPPGAMSRLAFRALGTPEIGMSTTLRIDSPEMTAYLSGTSAVSNALSVRLSGDLSLDARDGRNLVGDVGGPRLVSNQPLPLRGQGRLDARDGIVDLANLALVTNGGVQIAGHLRAEPALAAVADHAPGIHRLSGALDISSLNVATLLAAVTMSHEAPIDYVSGAAATASVANSMTKSAKDSATVWPQGSFDFSGVNALDMAIKLKTSALVLADGAVVSDANFTLLARRDILEIRELEGTSLGGHVTASAQLEHVPAGATVNARIEAAGAQVATFGGAGAADVLLMVSGTGLNPAGIAASLTGGGVINLGKVDVHAVTPASLQAAINTALKAPPDKLGSVLQSQLSAETARPAIALGPRAIKITVEDGVARTEPVIITTNEGRVRSQAALDLSTYAINGDWRVETRLQPLPALPLSSATAGAAEMVAPPAPVTLPALVERFVLLPASLDPRTTSQRLPPEIDALERELAVRKVERDLAELERLRRLDELRAAEARAKEAQDIEQSEWKKQTEIKPAPKLEGAGGAAAGTLIPMARPAYSIGTLVTKSQQYAEMRQSFEAHGFTTSDCEYLSIDNAGPTQTGAYAGLNRLLNQAAAPLVILCHQDVLLLDDGRAALEARLAELDALDPHWAVAANAGGAAVRRIVRRITDKHGADQRVGTFPHRVASVDENFIVVKRETRIGFSRDLDGFHLYGADICLNADILGYSSYAIDFHLNHLGASVMGPAFAASEAAFRAKWQHALRDRSLQTPCTYMVLSGQPWFGAAARAREATHLRLARLRISLAKRRHRGGPDPWDKNK